MYDPTIGRWISEDPVDFEAGDSNLYRYAKNNPVASTDPSGLQERQTRSDYDRWLDYLSRNSRVPQNELLGYDQWLARERGRATPAPPQPPLSPLGPTPEQAERDRNERAFNQQQAIPEMPRIFERTPAEQARLDEQLAKLNYDLMYYEFWFYDVPGALSGLVVPGVGGPKRSSGGRVQAMPVRPSRAVQQAAQQRFEGDLARIGRITRQMNELGFSDREIAQWEE